MSFLDFEDDNSSNGYNSNNNGNMFSNNFGYQNDPWDSNFDTLTDSVFKFSSHVNFLDKMIKKVGTYEDSDTLRLKIKDKVRETSQIVNGPIKSSLGHANQLLIDSPPNLQKQRKVHLSKIQKDYKYQLSKLQDVTAIWNSKSRKAAPQKPKPQQPNSYNNNPDHIGEQHFYKEEPQDDNMSLLSEDMLIQNDARADHLAVQIDERDKGIAEIESGLLDINGMFRDLAEISLQQGSFVDSIENHIEHAVEDTSIGVQNLETAKEYQGKGNSKACIIIIILLIIVIVAVVLAVLGIGITIG
eukprot:TRINITY_DN3752_c0_g2_i1.p1 TRINITY_DN3752_c0_g2~~TRINITY_DN3752_c0_g2_i1.p1  ORF type:complete len:300 (+),score=100.43 TRINITY_DN3752_c0_g2_i1:27-926(+)